MSEVQFKQYNTLLIFAQEWRKYKIESKQLDESAFRTEMQTEQYVKIECLDAKQKRKIIIYLFDKNSKYTVSSQDLKKLLKKIKNPCHVILVTYKPLTTYGRKAINSFKHLNIVTYRHEIFDLVVPHGPLCYPHRVLSRDEVLHLCNNDLCCYLINLPKIFDEDPQCIWIGARVGDVVEIKMLSDITGETIQYRVVIPKSGRIIAATKEIKEETDERVKSVAADHEEVDEEVLEHLEHANADNDELDNDESEDDNVDE